MDVDGIVVGSLEELWNCKMKNNLIAAVKDIMNSNHKLNIGLNESETI